MRKVNLLFSIVVVIYSCLAWAQETDTSVIVAEVSKLDFLVGHWRTVSTIVQTGEQAPGELSYEKVLGGSYILCRFDGKHPSRDYWEAYVMITFDPDSGHYVSHAFFSHGPPVTYTGVWRDENTVTFTIDSGQSRINYTRMPDGSVFQLNEALDAESNWRPALETVYKLWESSD